MNAELTFKHWLKLRGVATADGSPAAPNSSDVDYQPGLAVGGATIQIDGHGGNGLVVIYWMTG